mmetsp:Transcript_1870/g.5578  ORF Transcript_1870/g.5578 Transcript_1870/m.5578 type:complete len:234 (+) Transcript_1870:32-733(+)
MCNTSLNFFLRHRGTLTTAQKHNKAQGENGCLISQVQLRAKPTMTTTTPVRRGRGVVVALEDVGGEGRRGLEKGNGLGGDGLVLCGEGVGDVGLDGDDVGGEFPAGVVASPAAAGEADEAGGGEAEDDVVEGGEEVDGGAEAAAGFVLLFAVFLLLFGEEGDAVAELAEGEAPLGPVKLEDEGVEGVAVQKGAHAVQHEGVEALGVHFHEERVDSTCRAPLVQTNGRDVVHWQ